MTEEITLVTSNKNKVREFKKVLEPEIKVKHIELEYPELRSDEPEEIVEMASRQLSDSVGKAVVVEDSGLFIKSLSGFPGTCTKYIFVRIGNEGILKVMEKVRDRKCHYKSAIGYCEPGKKAVSFFGIEEGKISRSVKGKYGWGQDPIFIPEKEKKTYGELRKDKEKYSVNVFRRRALEKLKRFLLS